MLVSCNVKHRNAVNAVNGDRSATSRACNLQHLQPCEMFQPRQRSDRGVGSFDVGDVHRRGWGQRFREPEPAHVGAHRPQRRVFDRVADIADHRQRTVTDIAARRPTKSNHPPHIQNRTTPTDPPTSATVPPDTRPATQKKGHLMTIETVAHSTVDSAAHRELAGRLCVALISTSTNQPVAGSRERRRWHRTVVDEASKIADLVFGVDDSSEPVP